MQEYGGLEYTMIALLLLLAGGGLVYGLRQRQKFRILRGALEQDLTPPVPNMAEVRLSEARFFQTQKLEALGKLAGGVAHDFNNVLAIIDGYVHMAQKVAPQDDERLALYLDKIDLASKRGAALTNQLLLFGRHRIAGDEVIDLATLIRDQEGLLYPLLDSSVCLDVSAEPDLRVECAPDALAQIIMNLVINARDAMPDGGRILIEARACEAADLPESLTVGQGEAFVLLSVSDSGVGMDRDTITRIFDPFFTTKDQGRGTGLGLSMVYGLVQDMKGGIDVQTTLGEGTVMRVYLPRTQAELPEKSSAAGENKTLRFDGYTALVAEDEPELLHLFCSMLEERGMEVIPAANGAEALARQDAYEGDIDFLITDVVMPSLNGVKLAELVQAARDETSVIFMSGFPASGRLSRIRIPDDATLLTKPVTFEQLAAALQSRMEEDVLVT